MPSRSIHVVTNDRISLFYWLDSIPLYICMAYIYHIFFMYLPIGEIHFLCVVFELSFKTSRWLLWFIWLYSGISLLKNQPHCLLATLVALYDLFSVLLSKRWASPAKRRIFRKIWELLITLIYTVCFVALGTNRSLLTWRWFSFIILMLLISPVVCRIRPKYQCIFSNGARHWGWMLYQSFIIPGHLSCWNAGLCMWVQFCNR